MGIFAIYETDAELENGHITACFDGVRPEIALGFPSDEVLSNEALNERLFGPDPNSPLLSIDDATGLKIQDLHNNLFAGDSCLSTEADLWRK